MGQSQSMENTETYDDTGDEKELLTLLLMGKTGHGKSSLGNSLLGCEFFKVSKQARSQTADVVCGYSEFESCSLKVVDGPGLQDTELSKLEDTERAVRNMSNALTMCSAGVDAFLFVYRYGTRFTEEDVSALETLWAIFGQDYLKHAIVVLTYGDLFDTEENTFDDWCKTQTGPFRELYKACNGRCVLFNNKEKGKEKQIAQREQLRQLVYDLKGHYGRYTADCFEQAASERQRLITVMKQPIMKEEIQRQAGILSSKIDKYRKQPSNMLRAEIERVIRKLKNEINTEDKGRGLLTDLMKTVEDIERNLHDVIQLHRLAARLENTRKASMIWDRILAVSIEKQDHIAEAEVKLLGKGTLQTESQSSRGCKRLALLLSLTALLTCLAVLLYVALVLATQFIRRDHDNHIQALMSGGDQMGFQELCLDYQRLVKNPYTQLRNDPVVEGLIQRKEGNVVKYCAENRVQLSAMLNAVARQQDTMKEAYRDMQKSSTVSVHKQMLSETWNSLTGYSVVKFDPSHNQGLGEQSRGATVLEDGIVILKTGTYYIYSNVFFNVNVTGKPSSNQKWSSHVHRTRPQRNSRTGIVLTSVHTLCFYCKRDLITSFTGGVFQLQSGDFVQVFLSDVGLVYFNSKSSYLGLVMISK